MNEETIDLSEFQQCVIHELPPLLDVCYVFNDSGCQLCTVYSVELSFAVTIFICIKIFHSLVFLHYFGLDISC